MLAISLKKGTEVIEWSANFPDVIPILRSWSIAKQQLRKQRKFRR